MTGVKANAGTIGVNAKVPYAHCKAGLDKSTHTSSIAEWAMNAGKWAGLITTTRLTDASPSGSLVFFSNIFRMQRVYCTRVLINTFIDNC